MPEFREDLLQFIWQHRLLRPGPYLSATGASVEIIHPGELNRDSGPDFSNARVRINGVLLAGSVEIHIRSSDWNRHQHQGDPNYHHLILHAVYEHDLTLAQNIDHGVEVLVLQPLIPDEVMDRYQRLMNNGNEIACHRQIGNMERLRMVSWLHRLATERLEEKTNATEKLFLSCNQDFALTFFKMLVRNLGQKVNVVPFEMLSHQLPLTVLMKHADNLLQLKALMLGVAGLLEDQTADDDTRTLQNEFEFLRQKYRLVRLDGHLFKFSRMRPANFPDRRLKQLAQLIHSRPQLFLHPDTFLSYDEFIEMLTGAGDFPGHDMAESIIINTIAPFLFFCGKKTGRDQLVTLSLSLMERCAPEDNRKVRMFPLNEDLISSALETQALIRLHDNYCAAHRCLQCRVGAAIVSEPEMSIFVK